MTNRTKHRSTRALGDGRIVSETSASFAPGSIAALESTLPPTPLKNLLSAEGAAVYVLSHDQSLVDAVVAGGGEQFPIRVVSSFEKLHALVTDGQCKIALIDADALGSGIAGQVRVLKSADALLVVLIAAPRATAEKLMGLLSDRTVHRLLIKPAAVGITRLLLESAVSRHFHLVQESQTFAPITTIAAPRRRPPPARSSSSWATWLLAAGFVMVLVGGIFALGFDESPTADGERAATETAAPPAAVDAGTTPSDQVAGAAVESSLGNAADGRAGEASPASAPPESAVSQRQAPEPPVADPHAEQVARAAAALAAGRIAAPPDDNALDLYASVLAEDPDNVAALRGQAAAIDSIFRAAEQALLDDDLDGAESSLEQVRRAQPDSSRLRFLEIQLQRERAVASTAVAPEPAAEQPDGTDTAEPAGASPPAQATAGSTPASSALRTEASAPAASEQAPAASAPAVAEQDGAASAPAVAEQDGAASAPAVPEEATAASAPAVLERGNAAPAPAASVPVAEPPRSEVDALLATAWERLRQARYLEPAGDSAVDYVDRAAALAPAHPDVLALRSALGAAVADTARVTLESGDIARATALANEAYRLGAPSEALAMLDLDLAAAREVLARREQSDMLDLANERMREDQLITPSDDSAFHHLTRLQSVNPGHPGLESAFIELRELIGAKAEAAVASGDVQAADAWLQALNAAGAADRASQLRAEVEANQRQNEFLAVPADPGELTTLAIGRVIYPEDAQRRGIEGWVDVEFVVGENGVPRDARVVAAMPPDWFEQAALGAVGLYRYEPFTVNGRVYERLARLRIRFGLE